MKMSVLFIVVLALAACTGDNGGDGQEVVSEPTRFADGFELVADQPVLPEDSNGEVVLMAEEGDVRRVWTHFRLGGNVPELASGEVMLFVGTGESGSCPIKVEEIITDGRDAHLETKEHESACTADFNPRTFVFALPAIDAPEVGGTLLVERRKFEIEAPADISLGRD